MKNLILLAALLPALGFAQNLSLSTILRHQTQNSKQSKWIENQVKSETLQSSVDASVWLTELSSSLERRFDVTERITGAQDNIVSNLPWFSNLKQKTPYGLRFNLEYYKELDDPFFRNAFQDERIKGSLEFSLLSDFLGKNSKTVLRSQSQVRTVFERKVKADLCLDISQKYIEAVENQEKLNITSASLKESEKVLRRLSKAVKRGALNKSAQSSMIIDVNNLRSELVILKKDLNGSVIALEEVSGVSITDQIFDKLKEPRYKTNNSKKVLAAETLKQEVALLKGQLANLKLNTNRDVFLYGGYESTKFTENNINIEGETDFGFFGVQAELRFGDTSYKNEESRLSAQIQVKKYELERNLSLAKKKDRAFLTSLVDLKKSYQILKSSVSQSESLDKKSYRDFYNGKTKYFEFLSSRNQISAFKRSIVSVKANFWKVYLDYLYLNGAVDELCSTGGGL